ncbi:MAG: hypothetical protein LBR31_04440 [Desulfovibrio sp.]|nr:hypothetical protein [Desulfovibrio sp.]
MDTLLTVIFAAVFLMWFIVVPLAWLFNEIGETLGMLAGSIEAFLDFIRR